MFGVEALARIVRHDARIEVKVPAARGKKAYSYFREGGEGEKKSSGVGKKVAVIGGGLALAGLGAAAIAMSRKKTEVGGMATPVSEPKKAENNTARNVAIGAGVTGLGAVGVVAYKRKAGQGKAQQNIAPPQGDLATGRRTPPIALLPPAGGSSAKPFLKNRKENEILKNGVIIARGLTDHEVRGIGEITRRLSVSDDVARKMFYSINNFTSGATAKIREAEKRREGFPLPELDNIDAVRTINNFLDLSPKYEGSIFRGLALKESAAKTFLDNIQQDGLVLEAMSSFSRRGDVAISFAEQERDDIKGERHIGIVIACENNKSGADISQISEFPKEREVLVPSGTFYKASRVEREYSSDLKELYYVYVDEVDPKNQKRRRENEI